jgi:hypothetical protein
MWNHISATHQYVKPSQICKNFYNLKIFQNLKLFKIVLSLSVKLCVFVCVFVPGFVATLYVIEAIHDNVINPMWRLGWIPPL